MPSDTKRSIRYSAKAFLLEEEDEDKAEEEAVFFELMYSHNVSHLFNLEQANIRQVAHAVRELFLAFIGLFFPAIVLLEINFETDGAT
jgi:hypothetical protein